MKRWFGSPLPAVATASPLLFARLNLLPCVSNEPWSGVPFWSIFGLSLLLLLVALLLQLWSRSVPAICLILALLTGQFWLGWTVATAFNGTVDQGVGEPYPIFRELDRGPLAGPPPPLPVLAKVDGESGQCTFQVDDDSLTVFINKSVVFGRYTLNPISIDHAPLFSLKGGDGAAQTLLVKLDDPGNSRRFFEYDILPFRFYCQRVPDSAAPGTNLPESLSCAVVRGKHIIARGGMTPGQPLTFEGFELSYGMGAPWVTLRVGRKVSRWPGALMALLMTVAILGLWKGRR